MRLYKASPRLSGGPIQRVLHASPKRFASTSTQTASPNLRRNAMISGFLISSGLALYIWEKQNAPTVSSPTTSTFAINIGRQANTFTRLSDSDAEAKLRAHEKKQIVNRPGNPVIRYEQNWLGSNEPCEDRSAVDMIPRSRGVQGGWFGKSTLETGEGIEGKKDLMFFSVFDGHAGWATSELLSRTLHPTLALSLASLQAGHVPQPYGMKPSLKALAGYLNPLSYLSSEKAWTPGNVIFSLQNAFLQIDENICQTPIRLLSTLQSKSPTSDPSAPTPGQTFVAMAQPANAGACAISAVVDAENDDLYVALTGDCRAVAGWEVDGRWRCDVLTEDQMGECPNEVARIRSEHPASERDTCISSGRIQGGLQPTRAFGDAVYKWTSGHVRNAFSAEGEKSRTQRPTHYTPPYVTAKPEATHRKIHPSSGEKLKFVIMATDGLWDRMTSEEATLLLASYLSHPTHTDIPKSTLPANFHLMPPMTERLYPAEDLPGSKPRASGAWAYEGDQNAATHLIRNSLGGADRNKRGELLSITGKVTRYLRDDITVTVVFFGDN